MHRLGGAGRVHAKPKVYDARLPKELQEQRLQMHEGLLDDRADCLDVAKTQNACITHPDIASGCAGTCKTHEFCASEADPEECERALRCRELKDDWSDCASRVADKGCEDEGSAATLLKHCYLSCARVGRASLLRRFRLKYTVRTRKHGYIDEDELPGMGERLGWRPAFSQTWSLPCWKSTVYDERPPATCANPRAEIVHRWLKLAEPKCRALKETTPRARLGGRWSCRMSICRGVWCREVVVEVVSGQRCSVVVEMVVVARRRRRRQLPQTATAAAAAAAMVF